METEAAVLVMEVQHKWLVPCRCPCLQGNKGGTSPSTGKEDHVQDSWAGGRDACVSWHLEAWNMFRVVGSQTNTNQSNPGSTKPLGKRINRRAFLTE
jgi:hypothetical protein